jgi:hypothetical protein
MPDRAQLGHDGAGEIIDIAELAIEARRDRRQVTTTQDRLRGAVERRLVMVDRGEHNESARTLIADMPRDMDFCPMDHKRKHSCWGNEAFA